MEPLGSRCAKFRFQPVEQLDALARLQYIATSEKLQASEEVLKFLINFSEGDLRKAINLLQSAHRFISQQQSSIESAKKLSLEFVHELTGFIPSSIVETFLQQVPSSLDKAVTLSAEIVRSGYSVTQFISQLHTLLLSKYEIQSLQKSLLATKFALYEKCLLDGADAELQLISLATDMAEYLSPHKRQVSVYSI